MKWSLLPETTTKLSRFAGKSTILEEIPYRHANIWKEIQDDGVPEMARGRENFSQKVLPLDEGTGNKKDDTANTSLAWALRVKGACSINPTLLSCSLQQTRG